MYIFFALDLIYLVQILNHFSLIQILRILNSLFYILSNY